MNEFQKSMKDAFDFAETLPSSGTMLRPAANRAHIIAARDGVFRGAVIRSIVGARAVSATADDFIKTTCGSIDCESADALYASDASVDAAETFAELVIKQYGSAESFARHTLRVA